LFPEVRVKRVLELRGADMVPPPYLHALAAIWVGLLHHPPARAAAWELTQGWTFRERLEFQADVARHALDARGPGGRAARDLARELLSAARAGLAACAAETGDDARHELDPIEDVLARGTLAERALVTLQEARGDPAALVRFWQIA
jgi:glutamate--cysteine ligase